MGFENVISPEALAQLRDNLKDGSEQKPVNLNKRTHKVARFNADDASVLNGEFIAIPLNMLCLRSKGLSPGDVVVMAFIHRYQRMDADGFCRLNATSIAHTLGLSKSGLSNHFSKLNSLQILVHENRGAEKVFRVDEARWAELCEITPDSADALRIWTTGGVFCRVPLWAACDTRLTDVDKILFGRINSYYAQKSHDAFRQSIKTTVSELYIARSTIKNSLARLVELGLLTKFDHGPRIPAEYIVNESGCERFVSEGLNP